jgi:nucleotide-binding universal stress UspA family protein
MIKKILLAVDESAQSKQLIRYAAKICGTENVRFTLFHIEHFAPEIFTRAAEENAAVKAELEMIKKEEETGEWSTRSLKKSLQDEGVSEDRIETVVRPIQQGIAKDILTYAEDGRFDAIAIARTGLTPRRDVFIGTVPEKIVEHALDIPVWIIDDDLISLDFLLAVDGSENSLRDVEHIIRVVGLNPEFKLTLFHVLPRLRHYYSLEVEKRCPGLQDVLRDFDNKRMEAFYTEAREQFGKAGIDSSRISKITNSMSYDISTAILDEARREYGTIVIGRRGERNAFFTGRIALRMVQKLSGRNLWIVP